MLGTHRKNFAWLNQIGCWLTFLSLSVAATAESLPQLERTEEGFPSRPIRLIVYTSPGGLIDTTAREFARIARKHFREQPIVVINRPGAGGIVAFEDALQQPADGHTILAVTRSNISKFVATQREDLIDRLDWHSYLMDNAHVVITNVSEGVTSWEDVVRLAEERSNSIWVGVDIGGVKHVSGVKVGLQSDIDVRWIPFASGGQAVAALLGGMGTAYLGNPRDAVGRDDLKVVAVCSSKRLPDFPDAPTFAEMGIDGLEGERIWRGLALKKDTPDHVKDWLDQLVQRVVNDPEWAAFWEGEGLNLGYHGSETFTRMVHDDREEFRHYLTQMGLLRESGSEAGPWALLLSGSGFAAFLAIVLILPFGFAYALKFTTWKNRRSEALAAALFLSLAVILYVLTREMPPASLVDPVGAAGVPILWLSLLTPLAFYQLWRLGTGKDREAEENPPGLTPQGCIFVGGLMLYAIAIPWTGYLLTTIVFLPAILFYFGVRKPLVILAITLGWALFVYFIFQGMLNVDLPRGRWLTL